MKKMLKLLVIWCSLSFIGIFSIYLLHGENLKLLRIDLLNMFADNQRVFWREILPLVILLTLFLGICKFKTRAYSFIVKIFIKEHEIKLEICYLKLFHKYINWTALMSVLAALVLGGYGIVEVRNLEAKRDYLSAPLIIHAMGKINGRSYTNSLEAFQAHYANGQRYFETDFSVTADDQLVARHDWREGWQEGIDYEHIPTEEVFLSTPLFAGFTPLSLKDIILLMQQHEDVYIITDTKDSDPVLARKEISILVETAEEMNTMDVLDRFVVQIYSTEMYEAIKDIYDFPHYIFTLYSIWFGEESEFVDYCRFCVANGIRTITMWYYRYTDNPNIPMIADRYGIQIYVHTINDRELAKELLSLGAYGIYTDDESVMDDD